MLKNEKSQKLYLLDVNADDSETYIQNLTKLRNKGFNITLIDHHPLAASYDERLKDEGIQVIRDTSISCSELVFKYFIEKIKDFLNADYNYKLREMGVNLDVIKLSQGLVVKHVLKALVDVLSDSSTQSYAVLMVNNALRGYDFKFTFLNNLLYNF